ncbi:GNAT family N-acetyltransferase [Microbulbifer sp. OS29]|uniref:GNAT family N-acetyltransferase n=1 Tax=Microbulbifer okhotskensis TaxID=2926617 RepID=A0A9X2J741_9GAMM|nr:GNAT family N-acetyltransferase [Microbulbifer okhotskensis]MCO1336164.1 GNAT family N-acetyltransferase [Microbulbifer okhotskensis]
MIRKYNKNDYRCLLDIYSRSKLDELRFESRSFDLLPLDEDKKRFASLMESDIYVYEKSEVVGYCALYGNEIRALFVHPSSRGEGIGCALLEHLLAKISGPALLHVAKTNDPVKNLYRKYGFFVTREFEATYSGIPVLANEMVRLPRSD